MVHIINIYILYTQKLRGMLNLVYFVGTDLSTKF